MVAAEIFVLPEDTNENIFTSLIFLRKTFTHNCDVLIFRDNIICILLYEHENAKKLSLESFSVVMAPVIFNQMHSALNAFGWNEPHICVEILYKKKFKYLKKIKNSVMEFCVNIELYTAKFYLKIIVL